MWINDDFYNELMNVLQGFSQNKVDFNEERFKAFENMKYKRLISLLRGIKTNTKNNLDANIKIMTSLEELENYND